MKLAELSPRRRQIVELLAQGKAEDKEIAAAIGVSVSAVRMAFNRLENELGIWGKIPILRYFYELTPKL